MVSVDDLHAGWMVLNNLLGELRSKGVFIPDLVYADLRNSKMVIEYLRSFGSEIKQPEQCDADLQQEIEIKVQALRETLMVWAEEKDGVQYRQAWETRFGDAIHGRGEVASEDPPTPISDLPREKDVSFFRIRLPDEIPVEIVSELAEDCSVLITLDGDRHLQVSGKKECVRDAMKRLGELFYGRGELG